MSLRDNDTDATLVGTLDEVRAQLKKFPKVTPEFEAELRAKIARKKAAEQRAAASGKPERGSGVKVS